MNNNKIIRLTTIITILLTIIVFIIVPIKCDNSSISEFEILKQKYQELIKDYQKLQKKQKKIELVIDSLLIENKYFKNNTNYKNNEKLFNEIYYLRKGLRDKELKIKALKTYKDTTKFLLLRYITNKDTANFDINNFIKEQDSLISAIENSYILLDSSLYAKLDTAYTTINEYKYDNKTLKSLLNENIEYLMNFNNERITNSNISFLIDDTMKVDKNSDAFLVITPDTINHNKIKIFGAYTNSNILNKETKEKLLKHKIDTIIELDGKFVKASLINNNKNNDFLIQLSHGYDSIQEINFSNKLKPLEWHWNIVPLKEGTDKRLTLLITVNDTVKNKKLQKEPIHKKIVVEDLKMNSWSKKMKKWGIPPELLLEIITGLLGLIGMLITYFVSHKKLKKQISNLQNDNETLEIRNRDKISELKEIKKKEITDLKEIKNEKISELKVRFNNLENEKKDFENKYNSLFAELEQKEDIYQHMKNKKLKKVTKYQEFEDKLNTKETKLEELENKLKSDRQEILKGKQKIKDEEQKLANELNFYQQLNTFMKKGEMKEACEFVDNKIIDLKNTK